MIIDIFKNYFLILDIELIPMLSGFISSLLSAAEEQDEKIQTMINDMLFQINMRVGDGFYISTLWLLLLKNSKNRIATFKVLFKKFAELTQGSKIGKYKMEKISEPALQLIYDKINQTNGQIESFYPNTLMIANAFAMCLEDEDVSTRKNCLDFIIKYIDLNNDSLFDDAKRMIIFESLIKILDNDELSIVRRVFKMLFDANDLNSIEKSSKNMKMMYFLAKAFITLLFCKPTTAYQIQRPFKILNVLNKSNEQLTRTVLKQVAMPLSEYIFQNGYSKFSDFNYLVVEQTKKFIKDFEIYLEDFLDSINVETQQSSLQIEQLLLIEFVMKVLVIESNIPTTSKFRFMISLMDSIFQQLDKHFEGSLNPKRLSVSNIGNEVKINKTARFEKIIHLLSQCVIILEGMTKTTKISIDSNLQQRIRDLLIKDTALLDETLSNIVGQNEILDNYSTIFSVLMEIDVLQSSKITQENAVTNFDQLPKWLQSQFKFLQSKNETLSYSALNFLFSMFEYEKKSTIIVHYNSFIFKTKLHYEKGNICWLILSKVVDMVEIYDFKKLALKFFFKLVGFHISFTSNFLLSILATKKPENFNKIALIWNSTSSNRTSDCRLVLQETVFEMLKFIEMKDLMISHYFKSWINQSNDNLTIILQTVLKSLIKYTSWNFNEITVSYKIPFDCSKFIQSLAYLVTVYDNSTFNFLNYIIKTKIPVEFEFYDEEMTLVLKSFFTSDETTFFIFILKLLLRYILGTLNANNDENTEAVYAHLDNVHAVKEAIVIFMEKLLRSLEKMDIIKSAIIPLIKIFSFLIEKSFEANNEKLQICYLNFLEFLIFKTGLVSQDTHKDSVYALISTSRIMPCFLLSLKSDQYYVVKEFVKFGCELNFLLAKYLKYPTLFKEVNQVLFFYLDSIIIRCQRAESLKEEEKQKAIVTELMSGLRICLTTFLQVDEIEEKISSSPFEHAFFALFTLGMIQPKEETKKRLAFIKDEHTCKHLLTLFEKIFSMLCVCWKKTGLVQEAYLFEAYDRNTSFVTKDDRNLVGISKQILEILKPLTDTFLEATTESFIENWIANNDIVDPFGLETPTSFYENSKILEAILHLQIPPIKLLYSLLGGKQMKNLALAKRYNQTKKDKDLVIDRKILTYECSFLSFLFSYLRFLPNSNIANFEICGIIVKLLKQFDVSTTPATLCWLLDIISLTIEKYPIDFNNYSALKLEYVTLVSDLILKSIKTILKETTLSYKESEKPFKMITPFSPAITEFLKENEQHFLKPWTKEAEDDRDIISVSYSQNSRVFRTQTR